MLPTDDAPPDDPPIADTRVGDGRCASCGAALVGPFCHRCGERTVDPSTETLRSYAQQALGALTNLDGRWPRAVRQVIFEPGRQAQDWLAGRRTSMPGPWPLFLAANVVYYFATSFLNVGLMRATLHSQTGPPTLWAKWATERAYSYATAAGLEWSEFAALYDARAESVSKLLVVTLIPMFAVLLWIAHRRHARHPLAHLVLATHFIAYWALLPSLALPFLAEVGSSFLDRQTEADLSWLDGDPVTLPVILASGGAWLYFAERRLYGARSRWGAAARAVLMTVALLVLIIVPFRFMEFIVTWWLL